MNPEEKSRAANPASIQALHDDYTTKTALQASFSAFRNSFDTEPAGETTLEQLAADIQGGKWQIQVERLRAMTADEYSQNKRNLPAVAFGGIFSRRKKDALITPSGLVVIDIDHVSGHELADIKSKLTADRHTALCFVSPSGAGLKAVFVADFSDDATFKQAYRAISAYLMATYGLKIDESGKDICRLCYVSHDPEAYYNPDAVQFCYEVAAVDEPQRPAKPATVKQRPATVEALYTEHYKEYIEGLIQSEAENIRTAETGSGNATLNEAAFKLAHFEHTGLLSKAEIKQRFCNEYLARPGSAKTEARAETTFESGWQAGAAEPRNPPNPKHEYSGGSFELTASGVYYFAPEKEGSKPAPLWICSPLIIRAQTRDTASTEWGRLLEWIDKDGKRHEWAMPAELLQGDGIEARRELSRLGVDISPFSKARNLFNVYLQLWPVKARARCTQRLGWHSGVYVLPDRVIGSDGEKVVFQNISPIEPAFEVAGSVEEWRGSVATLAEGNSRIVFAISAAFAAPLAGLINAEGGGFHFRGGSSTGKSTALTVAGSVWGGKDFIRAWRATGNGLEGLAALHNDGLLILDEISEIDPREAGAAAYMLANGQGKTRANRTGEARRASKWRLIYLSAGEESLSALMAKADKKANAGQELRLADIDADAGAGMGMFQDLHGAAKPGALALALKEAAEKWHGAAGVEFLRQVVEHKNETAETLTDGIKQFIEEIELPEKAAQAGRVARRFALVAVAGEIATACGLTGWQQGEAERAAKECFTAWLAGYGGQHDREEKTILEQVRHFLEQHGASRFEQIGADDSFRITNRAGFWRPRGDVREYLLLPEAFKNEVCKGLDHRRALHILTKHGWIEPGSDRPAQQIPIPAQQQGSLGTNKPRVYVLTRQAWEAEP